MFQINTKKRVESVNEVTIHVITDAPINLEKIKLKILTFKNEVYLFYIRTQCVPRCKHSPLRL
jgi:hypothetical protein